MEKKIGLYCKIALVIAALILGMSFVAQKAGMEYVEPFTFNTLRFFIGSFSLFILIRLIDRFGGAKKEQYLTSDLVKGGVLAGIVLFFGFSINQICMIYSQAGKAGFITSLYIIFVPLICVFMKQKLEANVKIGIVIALAGLYLLCAKGSLHFDAWDFGLLVSAVFFALHIILVSFYTHKTNALKLSCLQFAVAGVLSLPMMFIFENPAITDIIAGYRPILFIGLVVTGVAYTLQIIGQKAAKPVLATMILSSEAVFAVLGGIFLLGETLNAREITGCFLMVIAIIVSQMRLEPSRHPQPQVCLSGDSVHLRHPSQRGR